MLIGGIIRNHNPNRFSHIDPSYGQKVDSQQNAGAQIDA
jgi:hypothetical protein